MMTGLVLGVAMLVAGGSPGPRQSSAAMMPGAFTFNLSDGFAGPSKLSRDLLDEQSRRVWPRASLPPAQTAPPKRFTKTDKVIAIAAGAVGGFLAGGYIGGFITENRDNPDDDTSVLKGIMIGAPIGAVIGAVIGHKLTK